MQKKLYNIEEITEVLGVSARTVEYWRKDGLPFIKIGRITRYDVDKVMDWVNMHEVNKKK